MTAATISVWVPGDQLLAAHPAIAAAEQRAPRDRVRVILVESQARVARPAHRHRLVLVLSAMRHYAQELRALGYQVDYLRAPSVLAALREHVAMHRPAALLTMAAAEYAPRQAQGRLTERLGVPVEVLPNTQFLVGEADPLPGSPPGKRVVMETFYRTMRRRHGMLLESDGAPAGGAWNFDHDNRRPLPRGARPPAPLTFEPDAITREVMAEIDADGRGVGSAGSFRLAVTHAQARAALEEFVASRLASFGPYEDAMSDAHDTLYHSVLAPYVNIGLLEPLQMARAAEEAYRAGRVSIQSAEGFVRQIVGWREFIYWQYWRQMPTLREKNAWGARRPMPRLFWDARTDMRCLRRVVERAISTGYTHHIERLMLVCNFCLLAGVEPQQVVEWFTAHYIDAYDWVMQPNVVGMGLNADGGVIATKPYIASANYIGRMGDYCSGCAYDPRRRTGEGACPFNTLYWSFLIEHEAELRANPRLGPSVLGLGRVSPEERAAISADARRFLETLE
ncbi:MAG: hypothetical protein RLZZ387_92 [Chloroflexota bacterium]